MSELSEIRRNAYKQLDKTLLELFGSNASKFGGQTKLTTVVANPGKSQQVIRNPDLFQGEIYTDHTRLPPHRWSLFRKPTVLPRQGGIFHVKFDYVFIMGYEFSLDQIEGHLYELWYSAWNGKYIIVDRYAAPVVSNILNLSDAITDFVNLVGEENPTVSKSELSGRETAVLKNIARRNKASFEAKRETEAVKLLLEESQISRSTITQALNSQVLEYHHTRMDSHATKGFFQFWGKFVDIPQKYISSGLTGMAQRIVGKGKIATFIVGFSLQNRVDIEIWYVRNASTGLGSYYVFDLTSLKVVAKHLQTIRQAYIAAGKKIALPNEILSKIE